MKLFNRAVTKPQTKSVIPWRMGATILISGILMGLCGIAEAKKPIKPPPEPPPLEESGVIYFRFAPEWGSYPAYMTQVAPDGSNVTRLFLIPNSAPTGQAVVISKNRYSRGQLFGLSTPNVYEGTEGTFIANSSLGLYCTGSDPDAEPEFLGDLMPPDCFDILGAAWYDNDTKLALYGGKIEEDSEMGARYNPELMGFFVYDISLDGDCVPTIGEPEWVPWTRFLMSGEEVPNDPGDYYYYVKAWDVLPGPDGVDVLYFSVVDGNGLGLTENLYYAQLQGGDGTLMEFSSLEGTYEEIRIDPTGSYLLGSSSGGSIEVFDVVTHEEVSIIQNSRYRYGSVGWSPSGQNICYSGGKVLSFFSDIFTATSSGDDIEKIWRSGGAGRQFGVFGWRTLP